MGVTLWSRYDGRAQIHDEDIHPAVIIEIAEGSTTRNGFHSLDERTCRRGDILEFPVPQAAEDGMLHRNHVNQPAVRDEEILPSVVIEIVDAGSPTGVLRGKLRDARLLGVVLKLQVAGVLHESVVFRVGNPKIDLPVVIEIEENRTHRGSILSALPVSDARA